MRISFNLNGKLKLMPAARFPDIDDDTVRFLSYIIIRLPTCISRPPCSLRKAPSSNVFDDPISRYNTNTVLRAGLPEGLLGEYPYE